MVGYVSVILSEHLKNTVRNMCLNIHIILLQITNNMYWNKYVLVLVLLLVNFNARAVVVDVAR